IGPDSLPRFPRLAEEKPGRPGHEGLPDTEGRLVPPAAVEVDLAAPLEKRQGPQALRVELAPPEPRELVPVDHDEEAPVLPAPGLLVNSVEGLRTPEPFAKNRFPREREERFRVAPGEDAAEGARDLGQRAVEAGLGDRALHREEGREDRVGPAG